MISNPSSIYAKKQARDETLRSISSNEEELRLNTIIANLRQENERLQGINLQTAEELLNSQACMLLNESEIKHAAEKKIKSLESELSFREQERRQLQQEHTRLLQEREQDSRKRSLELSITASREEPSHRSLMGVVSAGSQSDATLKESYAVKSTVRGEALQVFLSRFHELLLGMLAAPHKHTQQYYSPRTQSPDDNSSSFLGFVSQLASEVAACIARLPHDSPDMLPLLRTLSALANSQLRSIATSNNAYTPCKTPKTSRTQNYFCNHNTLVIPSFKICMSLLKCCLHSVLDCIDSTPAANTNSETKLPSSSFPSSALIGRHSIPLPNPHLKTTPNSSGVKRVLVFEERKDEHRATPTLIRQELYKTETINYQQLKCLQDLIFLSKNILRLFQDNREISILTIEILEDLLFHPVALNCIDFVNLLSTDAESLQQDSFEEEKRMWPNLLMATIEIADHKIKARLLKILQKLVSSREGFRQFISVQKARDVGIGRSFLQILSDSLAVNPHIEDDDRDYIGMQTSIVIFQLEVVKLYCSLVEIHQEDALLLLLNEPGDMKNKGNSCSETQTPGIAGIESGRSSKSKNSKVDLSLFDNVDFCIIEQLLATWIESIRILDYADDEIARYSIEDYSKELCFSCQKLFAKLTIIAGDSFRIALVTAGLDQQIIAILLRYYFSTIHRSLNHNPEDASRDLISVFIDATE